MSLTSPRRDQRRRLLVAWTRSTDETAAAGTAPRPTTVAPAPADPACQAMLGVVAPTGVGGFALTALLFLAPAVGVATATAWEPVTGSTLVPLAGRFAATLQTIRSGFDPATAAIPEWIAQMSLCLAAAYALAVRTVQRQRRDDHVGRYRAWTWLAVVFVVASLAGTTPLGPVVATALGDATGMRPGPGGAAWWIGISTVVGIAAGVWAVLPLRERSTTVAWLAALLLAWTASAVGSWLTAAGTTAWEHQVLATRIAWWAGCSFALVAMLAATRAVLRDVRGLVAPRTAGRRQSGGAAVTAPVAAETAASAGRRSSPSAQPSHTQPLCQDEEPSADSGTDADDASVGMTIADGGETPDFIEAEDDDADLRHLSKSERKRLRKLRRRRTAA